MTTENDKPEGDKPEGDAAPKPFTHADFSKEFNKAFSAREKRSNESLAKFKEELKKEILSAISSRQPEEPEDLDDDEKDEAEKPAAPAQAAQAPTDKSMARKLREIKKRQEATEAELKAERAARAEEAVKMARQEEKVRLTEALQLAGVNPEQMRSAISLLHGDPDTRRVRRSTDGVIVFVDEDGEEIDLQAGVKAWSESKEGKFYKPPRGAQGSGTEPPPRGGPKMSPKNGKLSKAEMGTILAQGIFNK